MCGSCPSKTATYLLSRATPTISQSVPSGLGNDQPLADRILTRQHLTGQRFVDDDDPCAIVTASPCVNPRPRTIGIRIVAKYDGAMSCKIHGARFVADTAASFAGHRIGADEVAHRRAERGAHRFDAGQREKPALELVVEGPRRAARRSRSGADRAAPSARRAGRNRGRPPARAARCARTVRRR